MSSVSIKGLDKVALLHALWDNTITAAFYKFNPNCSVPQWNEEYAKKAVLGYIDYF